MLGKRSAAFAATQSALAKGGGKLLSIFMSIVLVVGLCPGLAYAKQGAGSTGLVAENLTTLDEGDEGDEGDESHEGGEGDETAEKPTATFTPASEKQWEIVLGLHGQWVSVWDEEDGDSSYYKYDFPDFHDGDRIDVTYPGSEEPVTYTYSTAEEYGYQFQDSQGNFFLFNGYHPQSNQESTLKVGDEIIFTVIDLSTEATFDVTAKIVENPVKSVTFTQAKEIPKIIEGTGGHESEAWVASENEGEDPVLKTYYEYDFPGFTEGDQLEVEYADERDKVTYTYTTKHDEEGGAITAFWPNNDSLSYLLEYSDLDPRGSSTQTPAVSVGKYVTFKSGYYGHTFETRAEIIENPVESISFTPKTDFNFVTGIDCLADESSEGEISYRLDRIVDFSYGDILEVKYTDEENPVEYTYQYSEESGWYAFVAHDAKRAPINYWEVAFSDAEDDLQPWTIGEHKMVLSYLTKTCFVSMTVEENPVARISFTPAEPYAIEEYTNGHLDMDYETGNQYYVYNVPDFNTGDVLTVTSLDGTETKYKYDTDDSKFVSTDGNTIPNWNVDLNYVEDQPFALGEGGCRRDIQMQAELRWFDVHSPCEAG